MLTGRRTKLAIAAAILIVGTGTAFLFRREDTAGESAAAKKPAAAERVAKAIRGDKSPAPPTAEPALAGRIEPYGQGWANPPAARADAILAERVDMTSGSQSNAGLRAGQKAAAPAAEPPGATAVHERVAGYASPAENSSAKTSTAVDAPAPAAPRSQPYGTSATASPPAGFDRHSTVFERFADHRPPSSAPVEKLHRIVDGDTLASIARRHLGSEDRYLDLFEHNRDVLVTPELLPIGKELRIPPPDYRRQADLPAELPAEANTSGLTAVSPPRMTAAQSSARPQGIQSPQASHIAGESRLVQGAPATSAVQAPSQTYVVKAHDTLGLIARKFYGDISRQSDLISANRQQLRTPQDLRPGMRLVVPDRNPAQEAGMTNDQ